MSITKLSVTRLTSGLAALVTALGLAANGQAQLFKPFAFPPIESDFQFFAPADVDTYGGGPAEKTGWFADYDRLYINVQRPDNSYIASDKMGDFTWGNRVDIGFVDDDQKGWICTVWNIDGPNKNDIVVTERLNRWMDTGVPTAAAIFPLDDNNLRLTGSRDYLVTNSINVADINNVELNRTWRLDQLHYGSRLTPFAGLRYVQFVDHFRRDTYQRYNNSGFPISSLPFWGTSDAAGLGGASAETERLTSELTSVQNDMLGGQLGVHWDKDYRRWNISGDFKAFALENFQNWNNVDRRVTTFYGTAPVAMSDVPVAVVESEDGSSSNNAEFVFGMELRFDAAYRLTRDISLRGGAEFLDFGQGVGRGRDTRYNNQDVIMYGFTMGLTWNR
ncbi:MAG: hypothetical protein ACYC3X_23070 [Pirellulaceae bacterium]